MLFELHELAKHHCVKRTLVHYHLTRLFRLKPDNLKIQYSFPLMLAQICMIQKHLLERNPICSLNHRFIFLFATESTLF